MIKILIGVIIAVVVIVYSLLIAIIIIKGIFGEDNTSPEENQEQMEYLRKFYEREGRR